MKLAAEKENLRENPEGSREKYYPQRNKENHRKLLVRLLLSRKKTSLSLRYHGEKVILEFFNPEKMSFKKL